MNKMQQILQTKLKTICWTNFQSNTNVEEKTLSTLYFTNTFDHISQRLQKISILYVFIIVDKINL